MKPTSNIEQDAVQTHHEEEVNCRMQTDQADPQSLRTTLDMCINPLGEESHPDGALMNTVTGQIAHHVANADKAISPRQKAMTDFCNGWRSSFYDSLGKLVTAVDVHIKHVLTDKERVYDQELIYARVIGLQASSRDIDFNNVLAYELAAYPLQCSILTPK